MAHGGNEYEDLFKSELHTTEEDKVLIECPHCDTPITKSEVQEVIAKGKKGGNGITSGAVKDHVGKDNTQPHKGTPGKQAEYPIRSVKGAKKLDKVAIGAGYAHKSDDESADVEKGDAESESVDETETEAQPEKQAAVSKGFQRNSPAVLYYNSGLDDYCAKSIEEQSLGQGALLSQPMDKNQKR